MYLLSPLVKKKKKKNYNVSVWTQFSLTFYNFSPKSWTPPLTLSSVATIATRVSLTKNLKLSFTSPTKSPWKPSSSSTSPTKRVTMFCLSPPTSTHAHNHNKVFFSNALCSVSLSPPLYFDLFFRLLLLSIFERFFLVFFTW